jgi:hypothetical protein
MEKDLVHFKEFWANMCGMIFFEEKNVNEM